MKYSSVLLFCCLVFMNTFYSCGKEEMPPEEEVPMCSDLSLEELPELGKWGLNMIGVSVLGDVNILSSSLLSLTTKLSESCQNVKVTFERSSGRLDDLPWSFDISTNENWFWDLNQSTGVQTWTAQDENSEIRFNGFLPGTYKVEAFHNGSTTASQSKTLIADYDGYKVMAELPNPYGMVVDGNDLYVGNEIEILKYDLTNLEQEPEVVVDGLTNVTTLTKVGDILVFAERFEGIDGNLSKIDLSQEGASREIIITEMTHAFGLASRGSNVYVSDLREADILTFDLNSDVIELSKLGLSGLGAPIGISIDGDKLAVADESVGLLLFDFNDLSTSVTMPKEAGLTFTNQVYIKENFVYYNQIGKMVKVDINDPSLEIINPLSSLTRIRGIVVADGKEIITEMPLGRIIQINAE